MFTLLPNELWDYGPVDAMRGLRAALSSRHPDTRSDIRISGLGSSIGVRSARAAIVLALKALALPPNASVGVPLYCCPVVFKAIEAAGHRPRFIDVDPDTYCLSTADLAAKSSAVDAVIAAHMFGNLCDIVKLREAAPGRPFIEDCAQALGSRFDGRPVGSFGEIAAFSFRSGKYLSVGEGGAVYSSQTGFNSRLEELVRGLPAPTRADEFVHIATTYMRSQLRSKPLWGLVGTRLWAAYSERVSYKSQSPIVLQQIYETDRAVTVRRLPLLGLWIDKQRANADYYSRNLAVDPTMLCSEPPGAMYNRLQYPLLVPTSEQRDRLAARLRDHGISTSSPYKSIASIAATYYGYTGDCPNAERIARTVLVIPCHHALSAADVERIASCVKQAWAEVGGRGRGMGGPSNYIGAANSCVDNPATERIA